MNQEERDIFRQALEDVKSPGFEQAYWDALEQKLNKRKRRRSAYILLFCIAGAVTAASALLYSKYNGYSAHEQYQQDIPVTANPITTKVSENYLPTTNPEQKQPLHASGTQNIQGNTRIYNLPAEKNISGMMIHADELVPEYCKIAALPITKLPTAAISVPDMLSVSMPGKPALPAKPEHPSVKGSLSFDIASGIAYASRTLQANSASYTLMRRTNEEHNAFYALPGFYASYRFSNGLTAAAGLEYTGYGERIHYKPYSLQSIVNTNYYYVADSVPLLNVMSRRVTWRHDTTLYITQDTSITETENRQVQNANGNTRFSVVEIPLRIGYNWQYGKFSVGISGGLSFGFVQKYALRGSYLNAKGDGLQNLQSDKTSVPSFMVNYLVQVKLQRQLNDRTGIFVAPGFRGNLRNMYDKGQIQQRYRLSSLQFGISVML